MAPAPLAPREVAPRAPEDLALLVRINDPEQLGREALSVLPPSAAAVASAFAPSQMVALLVGKRLGGLVDLSHPIDIASVGLRDPSFVVSLAVKPEAEPRLGHELVLREEGGLLHVAKPDEPPGETGRMNVCAFTAAAGRRATRLICATDDSALEGTARYLARAVAAEPFEADARLTLPGRILRDHRGATHAIGAAASARLGTALVDRFVEEIDRFDADLRFAGPRVDVELALHLGARESMLARVLVPRSKPAPPPRAFSRLPADSLFAAHATGALPEDIAPLRRALAEDLESALVQDGYRAESAQALRQRVEALIMTGGPVALALGVTGGREGAEKALAAFEAAQGDAREAPRAEARARAALAPWMLAEVEEPPERWTQGLRDIVRGAQEAERTRAAGARASKPRDPDGDHVDMRIKALDPALRLPKDTLHLEVQITPRSRGSAPVRRAHLFVVPKGAATWLGYGEDEAAITSRLRLAADDATEAGTLGRLPEVAQLTARPALAAGTFSLGGFALLMAKTRTAEDLRAATKVASTLTRTGVRGTEIMTWTVSDDATPGAIQVALRLQASRQTVTELMRLWF